MRAREVLRRRPEAWSRTRVIVTGVALLAAVWWVDAVTGGEVSLSVLYLAPIAFGTWYAGSTAGVALSGSGAVLWLTADAIGGGVYSHPLIPFWNMLVRLGFFVVTALLLGALRAALEREARLARTDPLTGLDNHRAFYEAAGSELERAERYARPLSLVYLDLDDFKVVNDREGHSVGDELLRVVAEALRAELRASDRAARVGGDEIALLLPETGDDEVRLLVERLRRRLRQELAARGWPVTASAGVVTLRRGGGSVDDLLRRADVLLYEVKAAGKGEARFAVA